MKQHVEVGERVWVEDDATLNDPTAEKLDQALKRLFGKTRRELELLYSEDRGDCFFKLYERGIGVVEAVHGATIHKDCVVRRGLTGPTDRERLSELSIEIIKKGMSHERLHELGEIVGRSQNLSTSDGSVRAGLWEEAKGFHDALTKALRCGKSVIAEANRIDVDKLLEGDV